jgi:NADPH-dependent glutamate synthase beta subunit-like oxidoreductase
VPLRYNGKNVLVVGMGPAGYTLAHYLLNEGFGVAGVEGLRIEPLATDVRGSRKRVPRPIRNINDIAAKLDESTILGFGGVSEYGITVRWDKNFLDVNYLVLMRRKKFRLFDGVRFGGTVTIDDAWNLGFDHIAIATGAGRPTLVPVKNNVLRGMRQASDFLMGLQASGAYKKDSLTNLQVDLPAIVIGGGLTAIDTATELMAYYVVQVEKSLDRYERLVSRIGNESIWDRFDDEEKEVFQRWLVHGRAIRAERAAAQAAGRKPDFARLAHSWGGVTLVYRKRLQDAPAYRLNHEEVIKALEEGIHIAELLSPTECVPDAWGKVQAVKFARQTCAAGKYRSTGEVVELPARSVMVAAGTLNVIYERGIRDILAWTRIGSFSGISQKRRWAAPVPAKE